MKAVLIFSLFCWTVNCRQNLNEERIKKVKNGITKREVLTIMEHPDQAIAIPGGINTDESAYLYKQSAIVEADYMRIYFDNITGKVSGVGANP